MPVYIYDPLPLSAPKLAPEPLPFAEPPPSGLSLLPPDLAEAAPIYEVPSTAPVVAPTAGAAASAEGGGILGFLAPAAEVILPALALVLADPSSTLEDELLMPKESPKSLQDPIYPFTGGQSKARYAIIIRIFDAMFDTTGYNDYTVLVWVRISSISVRPLNNGLNTYSVFVVCQGVSGGDYQEASITYTQTLYNSNSPRSKYQGWSIQKVFRTGNQPDASGNPLPTALLQLPQLGGKH